MLEPRIGLSQRTRLRRVGACLAVVASLQLPHVARADADGGKIVVALQSAPIERWFDGTIEAVNQGTVSAQTAGRVEQILFDVNDFVPAGAVIVRLRGTEQRAGLSQAEAALKEAHAAQAEIQLRYKRVQELFGQSATSQQAVDQVAAERDVVLARVAAAQSHVDAAREGVSYTEVRSPYAGIVTKRHVQVGESVAPGSLLVSGISLQYLRVVVDLPQSVLQQVRSRPRAAIMVGDTRIDAKRIVIFPEASSPSHTFRTRLDLPENASDLYPGMFVKVAFVIGEAQKLLVPSSALLERSEITAVYVHDAQGHSSLRQVRIGHRAGGQVEVLAGLHAGESIARDATRVVEQPPSAVSSAHD